jgi:hypothetical protein
VIEDGFHIVQPDELEKVKAGRYEHVVQAVLELRLEELNYGPEEVVLDEIAVVKVISAQQAGFEEPHGGCKHV